MVLVPNSWIPEVDSEARVGVPWVFPVAVTVGISRAKALPGFLLPAECGVFPLFFFESYLEKYPCNLGP